MYRDNDYVLHDCERFRVTNKIFVIKMSEDIVYNLDNVEKAKSVVVKMSATNTNVKIMIKPRGSWFKWEQVFITSGGASTNSQEHEKVVAAINSAISMRNLTQQSVSI
jgi:hypothetical protein